MCPLIHAVAVILVSERAERFQRAIEMQDGDGGMADAIKHIGLDGGVVEHILEDDVLAHLQSMVEPPKAHEVAR